MCKENVKCEHKNWFALDSEVPYNVLYHPWALTKIYFFVNQLSDILLVKMRLKIKLFVTYFYI